jgi:hypothetical protein
MKIEEKVEGALSMQKLQRKWQTKLREADKRENDWRETVKGIYDNYTPLKPSESTFNILWTNTETLRQAVYNSLPNPMCSRRYDDGDPIGKAASEVLTRSLEFSQDPVNYDFNAVMIGDVMAMLLAGRAVSRIRYVPNFETIGGEERESEDDESAEHELDERISWESVIAERVQWDNFRILCDAKTWDLVETVAFKHCMSREDLVEKFGDAGQSVVLNTPVTPEEGADENTGTADVWEIWDKCEKQVIWIVRSHDVPLKVQDDPLGLIGFFPIPRPLYAIENDSTLVPAALYTQYRQQATELNRVSLRINGLVSALRVRGVYDATISELSQLMQASDNTLIPAQNVTALLERGGLEKAIWMMPIDMAAQVLQVLQAQREATKQVIYEITGISDIMRSATNANETFGAQKLKTQWGTQRLQRMQREVQRYIADIIRLKAEIISEKFQIDTLAKMTQIKHPTNEQLMLENQQQQVQWQQAAMQAQQTGQEPPPPPRPSDAITWEQIEAVLRDDSTRSFKIDIETDSTLTASQEEDLSDLRQVIDAMVNIANGFAPAVQSGAMPIEAVKEIMLTVARKAKLGGAVEDAIGKIQPPQPPADPEAGKAQAEQAKMQYQMQVDQMKMQAENSLMQQQMQFDAQKAQMQAELDAQVERDKQQAQAMQNAHQNELEQQREMLKQQNEAQLEAMRIEADERSKEKDAELQLIITQMNNQAKIEVAELGAQTTLATAQISAAQTRSISDADL